MKASYFSLVLVMTFSICFSQSKPANYNFKNNLPSTLFVTTKIDSVKVSSSTMMSKLVSNNFYTNQKVNPLPTKFNWISEINKLESYKEMIINARRDACGRDFPADVHYEVTQKAQLRNLSDR
jgi:hypothetical protein